MLSSATKMDIFPTFLQSEKDFDEVGSNYHCDRYISSLKMWN